MIYKHQKCTFEFMEDGLIAIIAILIAAIGAIGSIAPLVPGKPLAFIALIIFKYTNYGDFSWWSVIGAGLILIALTIFEYVLPSLGTKKSGGSWYSAVGSFIGIILGIIFAPFGFVSLLILPFVGAFLGEYLFNKKNRKNAFKVAWGSFIGFVISSGIGFLYGLIIFAYLLYKYLKVVDVNWLS